MAGRNDYGGIRSLRDHRRMGAALAKLPYGGEQPIVPLIACPIASNNTPERKRRSSGFRI